MAYGGHTESEVVYTWVYSCVHVGIQLCTRGYTIVYTRVHIPLLGKKSILGNQRPRGRRFLSRGSTPHTLCL